MVAPCAENLNGLYESHALKNGLPQARTTHYVQRPCRLVHVVWHCSLLFHCGLFPSCSCSSALKSAFGRSLAPVFRPRERLCGTGAAHACCNQGALRHQVRVSGEPWVDEWALTCEVPAWDRWALTKGEYSCYVHRKRSVSWMPIFWMPCLLALTQGHRYVGVALSMSVLSFCPWVPCQSMLCV